MARPKARQQKGKQSQLQSKSGKKRKQHDDFFEEPEDDAPLLYDDEAKAVSDDENGGGEGEEETAEEKRLRLAKSYLDQIRQYQQEGNTDEDASGDEIDATHAAVSQRLRQDALESMGHLHRRLAHRLELPQLPAVSSFDAKNHGRLLRGHKLSVTAIALTEDDATVYSVSKDGSILETDVETGKRVCFAMADSAAPNTRNGEAVTTGADWVRQGPRQSSSNSLLAAAVSSDGRYLAVGGGDKKVHIWDTRSRALLKSFPGHKDAITGLAFREGTHQLFSASMDRSVKIWSLDDMAYVDTLFGHQSEVLGIDALRQERVVTCAADRTCRVWKVAEESQLIFRGSNHTIECCRYLTGSEWVSGSVGGTLELWSSMKKKPVQRLLNAHSLQSAHVPAMQHGAASITEGMGVQGQILEVKSSDESSHDKGDGAGPLGAGCVSGDAAGWISAVSSCRGSDLVASGAGDGIIRLWCLADSTRGSKALQPLGGIPARGFVNGLAIARSGRFLVAGIGQEPRMGRWMRDPSARNGLLIHELALRSEG